MRSRRLSLPLAMTTLAATTTLTAVTAFAAPNALAGAAANELPDPKTYDGAVAWIPDTQYYSESHPEHFDAQSRWLAENAKQRKISYAAHTGDIVNNPLSKKQWENADASMKKLEDAKLPYGVVEGNHDRGGRYHDYFGQQRFENSPVYGESHKDNRQHYDITEIGGKKVMMLYLTWDMQKEDFDWAKKVLADHPDIPALVGVHAYLNTDGSYGEQGQQIFDRIVKPHNNVKAVMGGHYHGVANNQKDLGNGRKVAEMLADYQSGPEGGQGYMRLLQFDMNNDKMVVDTYSPSKDDSNYFDKGDDFTVDLSL